MPSQTLTPEIVTAAIDGFEAQKTRIDTQIAELRALLSGGPAEAVATPEAPKGKRRKVSAATRRAMAEGQRRRWAASKTVAASSAPAAASKPKRKLSAAGRAAIVAATKKRWALRRAEAAKVPAQKEKMSPARKAALVANLAKARAAKAKKAAVA